MENSISFELDAEFLVPVLQRLFHSKNVTVHHSSVRALKPGAGNPTSLGVYRVSGLAQIDSKDREFSVVVKHLANGLPMMDASAPDYWNYFKREIDFFESTLVSHIPAALGAPRYLGQTSLADNSVLFWNQDLGDLSGANWNWDLCVTATRLAAELNSGAVPTLEDFPWLSAGPQEWWLANKDLLMTNIDAELRHQAGSTSEFALYWPYTERLSEMLSAIRGARQVFVHGDFNLNNLVPGSSEATPIVALDWQLCGLAPVGYDVAAVFNTIQELGLGKGTREELDILCKAYVERFNALNSQPTTLAEVRLNVSLSGFIIVFIMGYWVSQPQAGNRESQNQARVRDTVQGPWASTLATYAGVLKEARF